MFINSMSHLIALRNNIYSLLSTHVLLSIFCFLLSERKDDSTRCLSLTRLSWLPLTHLTVAIYFFRLAVLAAQSKQNPLSHPAGQLISNPRTALCQQQAINQSALTLPSQARVILRSRAWRAGCHNNSTLATASAKESQIAVECDVLIACHEHHSSV